MRRFLLLLALLAAACPAPAYAQGYPGAAYPERGGGGVEPNVPIDRDGDGNSDYILCGDYDGDGTLSDLDIDACNALLTDTGSKALELVSGTFDIDLNNDGDGETGCANPRNPHVCIGSDTVLRGQGRDITILRATPTIANTYGISPLIGLDNSGDTYDTATTRSSNVAVRHLTVETGVSDTEPDSANGPIGIQFWDCDDCVVADVAVRNTGHACVHLGRTENTIGERILAEGCGSYDYDGVGGLVPGQAQPCLYLWSSDGFISKDSGYRDSRCENTNNGANIRANSGVERGKPFGRSTVNFTSAAQDRIAQIFDFDIGTNADEPIAAVVVWLAKVPGASSLTGDVEVEIQTVSAGQPTGTAASAGGHSYSFANFDSYPAADLTDEPQPIVFNSNAPATADLTEGPGNLFALVVRYTAANDAVRIELDDSASADTYNPAASADVFYGTTDTPVSQQTDFDLNFAVWTSYNLRPFYENVTVQNSTGSDSLGGSCMAIRTAVSPRVKGLKCQDTSALSFGGGGWVLDGKIEDLDIATLETSSSLDAVLFKPNCFGCEIHRGTLDTTRGNGGVPIKLEDWNRHAVIDGITLRSAGIGVDFGGGSVGSRFSNSSINGALDDCISIGSTADTDGVDGSVRNPRILDNVIRNCGDMGIDVFSASVVVGAVISGNTIEDTNGNAIRFLMDSTTSDRMLGASILGNYLRNWNRDTGVGGTTISGLYLDGRFDRMVIQGNIFDHDSLGGNRRAIDVRVDENGQDTVVTGNTCLGTYAASECILAVRDSPAVGDGLSITSNAGQTDYDTPTGLSGTGDPNGSINAWPGRMFLRLDPAAGGNALYIGSCEDSFNTGGPPQTTGSPDGLCDSDGASTALVN